MKKFLTLIILFIFICNDAQAVDNPSLDILKIIGGVIAGVEAGHILYLIGKKILVNKRSEEKIVVKTNFPPSVDNFLFFPEEKINTVFFTNRFEIVKEIALFTNTVEEQRVFITPEEKRIIDIFGKDYYYLVGLQYDKVGKPQKSKEYLLRSILIGIMVNESKDYLKKRFKMSEKDIEQALKLYKRKEKE